MCPRTTAASPHGRRPNRTPRRLFRAWLEEDLDIDHLWLLAPGQSRNLEHLIYIPTVRPLGKRLPQTNGNVPRLNGTNRVSEWSIAVCPYKGDMVDLESIGMHAHVFEGDDGKTLVLDHVCCSSYGELEECHGTHCPLRDPAFLRSYDLHGATTSDGGFEQFIEVESPPEPRWWQEKLRLAKKIG